MQRRDFIQNVVAGTGAGLVACAHKPEAASPGLFVPSMSHHEIEGFVKRLDDSMSALATAPTSNLLRGSSRESDVLARESMRSLLMVGSFHDLPEDARAHPLVQDRMHAALPEIDRSVLQMSDLLISLTPTERADLTRALREDPNLVLRASEWIDGEASRHGVSLKRRLHLRSLMLDIGNKFRQSSSLCIDKYDEKYTRLVGQQHQHDTPDRLLRARIGERGFWELQARSARYVEHWQRTTGTRSALVGSHGASSPYLASQSPDGRPGTRALKVGAWLLGMSLLTLGVGALIVTAGEFGGVFLMTAGVLGAIGGLIVLIVGAAVRAAKESR